MFDYDCGASGNTPCGLDNRILRSKCGSHLRRRATSAGERSARQEILPQAIPRLRSPRGCFFFFLLRLWFEPHHLRSMTRARKPSATRLGVKPCHPSQATRHYDGIGWLASVTPSFPACRWRKTVHRTVFLTLLALSGFESRLSKEEKFNHKGQTSLLGWAGGIRTHGMTESKSVALPLGYSPIFIYNLNILPQINVKCKMYI